MKKQLQTSSAGARHKLTFFLVLIFSMSTSLYSQDSGVSTAIVLTEAESHYVIEKDPGKYPIQKVNHSSFHGGSSVRLFDVGDRIGFPLNFPAGEYRIRIGLRTGEPGMSSSYIPWGYSIFFNETPLKFAQLGVASDEVDAYGRSYWGVVEARVQVTGKFTLSIQADKDWAGVDYIEMVPSKRVEAETSYTILNDVGRHPIKPEANSFFSGKSSTRIFNKGDKIRLTFNTPAGYYNLTARVRTGYHNMETYEGNGVSYLPDGYSFSIDNTAARFEAVYPIFYISYAYGGSVWGDMLKENVFLSDGTHTIDISANKEWGGVDYVDLILVPFAGARLAIGDVSVEKGAGVYPTRFNNSFTIKVEDDTREKVTLTLFDSFNRVVKKESRLAENKKIEVELSKESLTPGVYVLQLSTSKSKQLYRLIKE